MTAFRYLVRVITVGDYDCSVMLGNLQKVRNIWERLSRNFSREGAYPKVSGNFFKAVTQAVLLFREETCVLNPRMEWALSSFQHRVARHLAGSHTRRWGDGTLAEAMVEAGFEGIGTYVTRRHNTGAQYIATRPILDLCEQSARRPGAMVSRR